MKRVRLSASSSDDTVASERAMLFGRCRTVTICGINPTRVLMWTRKLWRIGPRDAENLPTKK